MSRDWFRKFLAATPMTRHFPQLRARCTWRFAATPSCFSVKGNLEFVSGVELFLLIAHGVSSSAQARVKVGEGTLPDSAQLILVAIHEDVSADDWSSLTFSFVKVQYVCETTVGASLFSSNAKRLLSSGVVLLWCTVVCKGSIQHLLETF